MFASWCVFHPWTRISDTYSHGQGNIFHINPQLLSHQTVQLVFIPPRKTKKKEWFCCPVNTLFFFGLAPYHTHCNDSHWQQSMHTHTTRTHTHTHIETQSYVQTNAGARIKLSRIPKVPKRKRIYIKKKQQKYSHKIIIKKRARRIAVFNTHTNTFTHRYIYIIHSSFT